MMLRTKLILVYIIIIAIPIISGAFIIFRDLRNEAINKAVIEAKHKTKALAVDIEHEIERMRRLDQMVANSFELKNFLAYEEDISVEEYMKFRKGYLSVFEKLKITNPEINSLRFFTYDNKILEMWPYIYNLKRINNESLNKLNSSKNTEIWQTNHSEDRISWDNSLSSKRVISLYHKIFYPNKQFLGVIEINMEVDKVFKNILGENNRDILYYMVINGNIITNKDNSAYIREDLPDYVLVETSKLATSEKFIEFKNNGKNMRAIKEDIPYINAQIVGIVLEENIKGQIKENRNRIIYLTCIVLLMLVFATNRFIKIILKKLKVIVQSMRKVQKGNLNIDIPVYGEDEMGELAYHFRKMLKRINELIEKLLNRQVAVKNAEIRALQTQINSHFIYNALENIKMMAIINYEYDISDSITLLGNLMRYSMDWKNHKVNVRDEIEYIKKYIAIVNICSDYKIYLNIEIEDSVLEIGILKMTIQPLVENAIQHGIIPKSTEGNVTIRNVIILEESYIEVLDDGIGMNESELKELKQSLSKEAYSINNTEEGNSIGLDNVKNRLELFYGYDKDELYIESIENKYTLVRIKIK